MRRYTEPVRDTEIPIHFMTTVVVFRLHNASLNCHKTALRQAPINPSSRGEGGVASRRAKMMSVQANR